MCPCWQNIFKLKTYILTNDKTRKHKYKFLKQTCNRHTIKKHLIGKETIILLDSHFLLPLLARHLPRNCETYNVINIINILDFSHKSFRIEFSTTIGTWIFKEWHRRAFHQPSHTSVLIWWKPPLIIHSFEGISNRFSRKPLNAAGKRQE